MSSTRHHLPNHQRKYSKRISYKYIWDTRFIPPWENSRHMISSPSSTRCQTSTGIFKNYPHFQARFVWHAKSHTVVLSLVRKQKNLSFWDIVTRNLSIQENFCTAAAFIAKTPKQPNAQSKKQNSIASSSPKQGMSGLLGKDTFHIAILFNLNILSVPKHILTNDSVL